MYLELLDLDDAICDDKWSVNMDNYSYRRIYFVKGGDAIYKSLTREVKLKPFHLYLFPTNEKYQITHNPESPLNHLWFHVNITPLIVEQFVEIDLKVKSEIGCLLDALKFIIFNGRNFDRLVDCLKLLFEILIDKRFISFHYINKTDDIINFIKKNIYNEITLDSLSLHSSYAKSYLYELFIKEVGMPPMKYIEKELMEEACRLIKDGMKIQKVSEILHYADTSTFSRSFKRVIGVSPIEYRVK
jgi:AraC-like DNA-binding protein